MVLVDRRGVTRQALPAIAASRTAAKKQRRHRVIIESVGQEQKKLKTTISFQARPPNGYTFIPAGNPELTNKLKEASREANQQIYAVSVSPHAQAHDLSKEVHRIGFHFPTVVVAKLCFDLGITLTSKGTVVEEKTRQKGGWNNGNVSDKNKDQKTINTEAKGAIKDLFPKIPDNDLFTIIKGAFQKGQKKVGTANELSLVRRAQLSVVAHVRHVYTKYDRLLRTVGYREARAQVEAPTLKKLVEWRGDDDDNTATDSRKQALEEVLREVIVLSDDEDSDDDVDDVVEVVSTRAIGGPPPNSNSLAESRPLSPYPYDYRSGDENNPGYRVVAQPPRRRRLVDATAQTQASAQYRLSAWDRAQEEYRANPSAVPTALVPLAQHDPSFYYQEPEFNFNDPPARFRQGPMDTRPEQYASYTDRQVLHDPRPMQPEFVRGADGHLYERIYTQPQQVTTPLRRHEIPQAYVSSQPPSPRSPRHALFHKGHDPRAQAISSHVLPSIEDSQPLPTVDGRFRAPQYDNLVDQNVGRSESHAQSTTRSRNVEVIDLTEGTDAQIAKRRRVEELFSTRRLVSDFDNMAPLEGRGRPAREPQRYGREIIDLSSPRRIRDPLPGNPRVVPDWGKDQGQGIRSDGRTFRPLVEVSHNAPTTRYVSGPDRVHVQDSSIGSPSTTVVRERQRAYPERYHVQQHDAEYRPEDPSIRRGAFVAAPTANGRDVFASASRVPVYDSGSVSYSRAYMPVIRNEAVMPDQVAHAHIQPVYADASRGPQHDRYERMPPPTYVRN